MSPRPKAGGSLWRIPRAVGCWCPGVLTTCRAPSRSHPSRRHHTHSVSRRQGKHGTCPQGSAR
eukprot:8614544-Pyramimonas_sp.AAC.1